MKDVIIIGAGPAGLAAAIYARRAGLSALVLEAQSYGGQIISTLEVANYPAIAKISGLDFAKNLYTQVEDLGAEFEFEKVEQISRKSGSFVVKTEDDSYATRAVIVATGAKKRRLGLAKEEQLIGRGVSYCATCDGNFFKDKTVAVVGGGNTAFEDAEYLAKLAKKVYLIHRREEFRADAKNVEKLRQQKNVEFILNATVEELYGDEKLTGVRLSKQGASEELFIDGLFVAIGQTPANIEFKDLLALDENGYVVAGENCHTNIDGIFVAGDNRTKGLRQLVTAVNDGAIAATEVVKYLDKEENV